MFRQVSILGLIGLLIRWLWVQFPPDPLTERLCIYESYTAIDAHSFKLTAFGPP